MAMFFVETSTIDIIYFNAKLYDLHWFDFAILLSVKCSYV